MGRGLILGIHTGFFKVPETFMDYFPHNLQRRVLIALKIINISEIV